MRKLRLLSPALGCSVNPGAGRHYCTVSPEPPPPPPSCSTCVADHMNDWKLIGDNIGNGAEYDKTELCGNGKSCEDTCDCGVCGSYGGCGSSCTAFPYRRFACCRAGDTSCEPLKVSHPARLEGRDSTADLQPLPSQETPAPPAPAPISPPSSGDPFVRLTCAGDSTQFESTAPNRFGPNHPSDCASYSLDDDCCRHATVGPCWANIYYCNFAYCNNDVGVDEANGGLTAAMVCGECGQCAAPPSPPSPPSPPPLAPACAQLEKYVLKNEVCSRCMTYGSSNGYWAERYYTGDAPYGTRDANGYFPGAPGFEQLKVAWRCDPRHVYPYSDPIPSGTVCRLACMSQVPGRTSQS